MTDECGSRINLQVLADLNAQGGKAESLLNDRAVESVNLLDAVSLRKLDLENHNHVREKEKVVCLTEAVSFSICVLEPLTVYYVPGPEALEPGAYGFFIP